MTKAALGMRYSRTKAALGTFSEEGNKLLLESVAEVEAALEKEKWSRVANLMEQKGASEKHGVVAL